MDQSRIDELLQQRDTLAGALKDALTMLEHVYEAEGHYVDEERLQWYRDALAGAGRQRGE